jgi:hypothetical protein
MLPVTMHRCSCCCLQEELRQGQAQQQQPSSSGPGSAASQQLGGAAATVATLAELALAVVDFEVCCVATWLHRRAAADAAAAAAGSGSNAAAVAAAEASVKAVPCIRNMLDVRSNSKLAAVWTRASELVRGGHGDRRGTLGSKQSASMTTDKDTAPICCAQTEGAHGAGCRMQHRNLKWF